MDHVLLYWAHQRGGYLWDIKTRKMFANDAGNLWLSLGFEPR